DLSLLTDGLRSEREQGITIDVAYKYFTTPRRKFIIADAPGHEQYTRNMVTGASNADLAIILIDARHGVVEQTRRHSMIASLLGIPHVVVCINKMDLLGYSEIRYNEIVNDYQELAKSLHFKHVEFIPVSALAGDNVVEKSGNTPWYDGLPLLELLETVEIESDKNLEDTRFQVQYVIRPKNDELHDYRGYAGQIQSGIYKVGDPVTVFPSGLSSEITAIEVNQQQVEEAFVNQPVVLHLKDDLDISRGNYIVKSNNTPTVSQDLEAMLCITDAASVNIGSKLLLQHNSATVKSIVKEIYYQLDVNNYHKIENPEAVKLNDLIKVKLRTAEPIAFDAYQKNRKTGAFILINENTGNTVAAGMLEETETE
ncbi:MAG: sulfate adenylyltransferase subunit 1, partial [Saprospiraceae bacterium]